MTVPEAELGGHVDLTGLPPIMSGRVTVQVEVLKAFTRGVLVIFLAVFAREPVGPQAGEAFGMGRWKEDGPWLGVKIADGRMATFAAGRTRPAAGPSAATISVARRMPSRVGRYLWLPFFITPFPSPGPLSLVFAWPTFDVAEAHLKITGQSLEDATRRVMPLAVPPL